MINVMKLICAVTFLFALPGKAYNDDSVAGSVSAPTPPPTRSNSASYTCCSKNTDCNANEACYFKTCTVACKTNDDCVGPQKWRLQCSNVSSSPTDTFCVAMQKDDITPASRKCYDISITANTRQRNLADSAIGLWVLVSILLIWMVYTIANGRRSTIANQRRSKTPAATFNGNLQSAQTKPSLTKTSLLL